MAIRAAESFQARRSSESLLQLRRGEQVRARQGATCVKLPWDSAAVVPTTVQRLWFVADQVTSEKMGVYRIADPLIAFRMLNLSFPERAPQKLEELLVEMFVGATRRSVVNLRLEACLSKGKGIAAESMREIASHLLLWSAGPEKAVRTRFCDQSTERAFGLAVCGR